MIFIKVIKIFANVIKSSQSKANLPQFYNTLQSKLFTSNRFVNKNYTRLKIISNKHLNLPTDVVKNKIK